MNKLVKKEKGFTIIEVVLVLAIAGLIFLVVFLALPQLQRTQRDSQRRSDLSRMAAALQSYKSNNNGTVPATQTNLDGFVTNYLRTDGAVFADPSGTNYTTTLSANTAYSTAVPANTILYFTAAACSGENAIAKTGANNVAIRINLEAGGSICQAV